MTQTHQDLASTEAYETFTLERRDESVDWLTLNRPDALNAMNARMIAELAEYFAARVHDTATRVIVLRASGRTFCAGLDLKEMTGLIEDLDTTARLRFQQRLSSIFTSMRRCPQPIVCLVQGAASGGGFALALAADLRYCTPDARMNAAFIKVGLSGCDVGMSYLLPRAVGSSVAAEMLMTGSFLDATRAASLGFVSAVVPAEELEAAGQKAVAALLQADPLGLALTKQGLQVGIDAPSLESAVANEDRQQALLAGADSFRSRIRAFLARK
jgi:enoyl-CoA hydratase/carnithine racemase